MVTSFLRGRATSRACCFFVNRFLPHLIRPPPSHVTPHCFPHKCSYIFPGPFRQKNYWPHPVFFHAELFSPSPFPPFPALRHLRYFPPPTLNDGLGFFPAGRFLVTFFPPNGSYRFPFPFFLLFVPAGGWWTFLFDPSSAF